MKKLSYIILLFSTLLFSQETDKKITFLDIALNPITENEFNLKSRTNLYQPSVIANDSIIINKLEYRYEFGELSGTELAQTQYLLKKQFGALDLKKNIIISYIDTLRGYNEYYNNIHLRKIYDFPDTLTQKSYDSYREKFDKQQKKCLKYADKENTIALYAYGTNNNFNDTSEHHKKHKLSSALIYKFFKHKKSGFVILKPNGEFFYYRYLTQDYVTKFLNESWTKFKNDIEAAKIDMVFNKINFVSEMREDQRNKMRIEMMDRARNQRPSNNNRNRTQMRRSNQTRMGRGRPMNQKPTCFTFQTF